MRRDPVRTGLHGRPAARGTLVGRGWWAATTTSRARTMQQPDTCGTPAADVDRRLPRRPPGRCRSPTSRSRSTTSVRTRSRLAKRRFPTASPPGVIRVRRGLAARCEPAGRCRPHPSSARSSPTASRSRTTTSMAGAPESNVSKPSSCSPCPVVQGGGAEPRRSEMSSSASMRRCLASAASTSLRSGVSGSKRATRSSSGPTGSPRTAGSSSSMTATGWSTS